MEEDTKILICVVVGVGFISGNILLEKNNMAIQLAVGQSMNSEENHLFNIEWLPEISSLPPWNLHLIKISNYEEVKEGDIIMFVSQYTNREGERILVTHRVVSKHITFLITKGDNNLWEDPLVYEEDVLAEVVRFPESLVIASGIEVPCIRLDALFVIGIIIFLTILISNKIIRKIYG